MKDFISQCFEYKDIFFVVFGEVEFGDAECDLPSVVH